MEVTRCPASYTWSHKDVIRLGHVNLGKLSVKTRIVLNYAFNGYQPTVDQFKSESAVQDFLNVLKILDKSHLKGEVEPLVVINRAENIQKEFGSFSIKDFPSKFLTNSQIIEFILEKGDSKTILNLIGCSEVVKVIYQSESLRALVISKFKEKDFSKNIDVFYALKLYNNCRRIYVESNSDISAGKRPKIWMKNALPAPVKVETLRSVILWTKELDEFFKAFDHVITTGLRVRIILLCNRLLLDLGLSVWLF